MVLPSKNRLARNIQILQVFFLQDLQDLALNLASLALKMKLFLQDMKNLARILQDKFSRLFCRKILIKSCKKIILQFFLARFLQDFFHLARKASFLVQDLQDMCKIQCKILQENNLRDVHVSCKTVFTGLKHHNNEHKTL